MRVHAWGGKQLEFMSVMGVSLAAALLYSSFTWGLPARFNSPDEAANAYFASRVTQGVPLAAPQPVAFSGIQNLVHPRSTTVVGNALIPSSFLGLPLIAGLVGRVFGASTLPYVTPLGAALGLTCFYLVLRELFGRRAAALALLLLAFTPSYWYYHARSFYHNALFFDMLLASWWLVLRALKSGRTPYYLLGGLAWGLAVAFRSSEAFWMSAAMVVWVASAGYKVSWRKLATFVLGAFLAFTPVFITNYYIYGQPFSVGYQADLALPLGQVGPSGSLWAQLVLPFGFHPRAIWSTVSRYLGGLTWWWAVLATLGVVSAVRWWPKFTREQRGWLLGSAVSVGWLLVLYGSWRFHDNPDPAAVTLGTSYMRYWLPVAALLLVPGALWLERLLRQHWWRTLVPVVVLAYALVSAQLVLGNSTEGLLQVRRNIIRFEATSQAVQQLTEPSSVIVTELTDKFFWPERSVMQATPREVALPTVAELLHRSMPVYSFHPTWRPQDLATVNQTQLAPYHVRLTPVAYGFADHSLYRFSLSSP